MAGRHGTRVEWADRDRLEAVIRPIVAARGIRLRIPLLTQEVADTLAALEEDADDDTHEWLARLRDGALLDFLYNRVALEVDRQRPIVITVGKTTRRDVNLKPYQGVRDAQTREFQQIYLWAMTKIEYDAWRKQEIAAIQAQSGKIQLINAIDALWLEYPDAATVSDLLARAGIDVTGARILLTS